MRSGTACFGNEYRKLSRTLLSQRKTGRVAKVRRFSLSMSRRQPRNWSRVQGSSMSSVTCARRRKSNVLGGMEEHGLRGEAGAEGHGASGLARLCALSNLLEDEHHGCRRHVAIV